MAQARTILVTGATGLLGGHVLAEVSRRDRASSRAGAPAGQTVWISKALRRSTMCSRASVRTSSFTARSGGHRRLCSRSGARPPHQRRGHRAARSGGEQVRCAPRSGVDGPRLRRGACALHGELGTGADVGLRSDEVGRRARSVARAAIRRRAGELLLFGPTRTDRRGFFDAQLAALKEGKPLSLFDDEWRTPLSLRAAAEGLWAIRPVRRSAGHSTSVGPSAWAGTKWVSGSAHRRCAFRSACSSVAHLCCGPHGRGRRAPTPRRVARYEPLHDSVSGDFDGLVRGRVSPHAGRLSSELCAAHSAMATRTSAAPAWKLANQVGELGNDLVRTLLPRSVHAVKSVVMVCGMMLTAVLVGCGASSDDVEYSG